MAMFRMVYATRFFRDPAARIPDVPGVHWTAVSATSCAPPADLRRAASQKQAPAPAQPMGMVESHGIDVFFVSPVSLCQFLEDF